MAITNHERVGKALELLKSGLGPFVQREIASTYKERAATEVSQFIGEDRLNAKRPITEWDVGVPLKLMWESWNDVFRLILGHTERSQVSELREHRNKWAHQETFSGDDTYRALECSQGCGAWCWWAIRSLRATRHQARWHHSSYTVGQARLAARLSDRCGYAGIDRKTGCRAQADGGREAPTACRCAAKRTDRWRRRNDGAGTRHRLDRNPHPTT
jgi:hypothetical protein